MRPVPVPSVTVTGVVPPARILDVREADEWEAGHIEGATHVPLAQVPARLEDLTGDGELVVVCRVGARSARAVAWLLQNGVRAVNLDGGMLAWEAAGRPMVSGSGAQPFVR